MAAPCSPVSAVFGTDPMDAFPWPWHKEVAGQASTPWSRWSSLSFTAMHLVRSKFFSVFTALVVMASLGLLVIEVNADAQCYPEYFQSFQDCPFSSLRIKWLEHANTALLLVFSVECLARACANGRHFLCNAWNLIDLATVLVGWAGKVWLSILNLNFLRAFRLLCICRSSRLVTSVPELYFLLVGLCASMRALAIAAGLLLFVLFLWAIIAVEMLYPVMSFCDGADCDYAAFSDVWSASITLLFAWEDVGIVHTVKEAPWTAAIFLGILVSFAFGVVNMVLVLILECSMRAYESNDHKLSWKDQKDKERCKESHAAANMEKLAVACSELDMMGRGILPIADLLHAYEDAGSNFHGMLLEAGVETKDQLATMCAVLATDDGYIVLADFMQHVRRLKQRNPSRDAFVEYAVLELKRLLHTELRASLSRRDFAPRLPRASPTARVEAVPEEGSEASPAPEAEALRRRWARHCVQSFESLQKGLEPLLSQAERALIEVLEETAFEPPDCRIEIIEIDDQASPDVPSRCDWLLDQRSAVLAASFRQSLSNLTSLQEKLSCVVQRLAKLRTGFDGRTESL